MQPVDAVARRRIVDRFGPSTGPWCDRLPEVVDGLAARWGLLVGPVSGGGTSYVVRCTAAGGVEVFLKLTPDLRIAAGEAAGLTAWRRCPQVVSLLDVDLDAGALLLAAVPGTLVSGGPHPPQPAVAGLLAALRTEVELRTEVDPPRPVLPPLAERVEFMFELARRRHGPGTGHAALLDRGRARALALTTDGPRGLVHGDLHPGNVLRRPDGLLVAIDPRPCLGDPDADAADWVVHGAEDVEQVRRRVAALAALVPGMDIARTLAWARALAVLDALPRLRRGTDDATTHTLVSLAGPGS